MTKSATKWHGQVSLLKLPIPAFAFFDPGHGLIQTFISSRFGLCFRNPHDVFLPERIGFIFKNFLRLRIIGQSLGQIIGSFKHGRHLCFLGGHREAFFVQLHRLRQQGKKRFLSGQIGHFGDFPQKTLGRLHLLALLEPGIAHQFCLNERKRTVRLIRRNHEHKIPLIIKMRVSPFNGLNYLRTHLMHRLPPIF